MVLSKIIVLITLLGFVHSILDPVINPADYPFTSILDPRLTVWWKIDEQHQTIEIALQCNCTGWVAFGLSLDSGWMPKSDASICMFKNGTALVEDYWIDIAAASGVKTDVSRNGVNNILEFTGMQNNGLSFYKFTRPLTTTDVDFDWQFTKDTLGAIYAGNQVSNNPKDGHDFKGGSKINFYTGSASIAVDTTRDLVFTHAILMLLAWAFFIPFGSVLARFGKSFFWWFNLHRMTQMTGLTLAVVAFIMAVKFSSTHFDGPHKIIGLIIIILALAQPVIGTVADRWWDPTRTSAPIFPDGLHWILGWGTLLLSFVNIALGIRMYNSFYDLKNNNFVAFVACAGAFVGVTIIVAILHKMRGGKSAHSYEPLDVDPLLK